YIPRSSVSRNSGLPAVARLFKSNRPEKEHLGWSLLPQNIGHEGIEIAAGKQKTRKIGGLGRLQVAQAIADHETALVADRPVLHQIVDHAGLRFAPVMVFEIALDRSFRMVRAIADIVDMRSLRCKFAPHPIMKFVELVFGEETARHAGLVGEEEDEIAGVVQTADRFRRVRHPADGFARAHIAVVMVDDAVPIEKSGGTHFAPRVAGPAHVPPFAVNARSIASQMPCASVR